MEVDANWQLCPPIFGEVGANVLAIWGRAWLRVYGLANHLAVADGTLNVASQASAQSVFFLMHFAQFSFTYQS